MTRPLLAALLFLATACGQGTPEEPDAPVVVLPDAGPIDLDDPRTCAPCHEQVVDEWTSSMHARAHQDADPIFGAMRALRQEKQGDEVVAKCADCHSPRDVEHLESTAAKNGVSCGPCHATVGVVEGTLGVAALVAGEPGVLRGPHDIAAEVSPAHGTGPAAPHLVDGQSLCLACHGETKTPTGAPACTTGPEHAASTVGRTCTDCHMPRVTGASGVASTRADHASHAFLGPHDAWYQDDPSFLASGVALSASLVDTTLSATLKNLSGHAVPTGFPGRVAAVVAVGFDAQGAEIALGAPDDPSRLLRKVYVDAEGNPTMPPFSAGLQSDTRLAPDEQRTLTWEVPPEVARAEVRLVFRLIPPPAAEKLGLEDAPEATPKVVARAEATR